MQNSIQLKSIPKCQSVWSMLSDKASTFPTYVSDPQSVYLAEYLDDRLGC